MSEHYFSGIRVGDKIWTIQEGWTVVENIVLEDNCPIKVKTCSFTMSGQFMTPDAHQSAFWSDPQIVAPPRPKRYKKVTMEVRPFKSRGGDGRTILEDEPVGFNSERTSWLGPIQTVTIEVGDD